MTALHFATFMGRTDIVEILVQEGYADPDMKDTQRRIAPIVIACEKGFLSIVRFLIEEVCLHIYMLTDT